METTKKQHVVVLEWDDTGYQFGVMVPLESDTPTHRKSFDTVEELIEFLDEWKY